MKCEWEEWESLQNWNIFVCKIQLEVEVIQLAIWVCLCGTLLKQMSQDCFVFLSLALQGAIVL